MNVKEFGGPQESIYILDDELVIAISFQDKRVSRTLPSEWIYPLRRQEIEDLKLESSTLVLYTKGKRQIKMTLFEPDKAFSTIKEWMRVD